MLLSAWFRAAIRPATTATYVCLTVILPVLMLTSMSATFAACELANPPIAMPRPVRITPVCFTEFATLGVQLAAFATAMSESRHCHWPGVAFAVCVPTPVPSGAVLMLFSRNW